MRGRQLVVGAATLLAGVGAAVGVAGGSAGGCCVLTINGSNFAEESAGSGVITITGSNLTQDVVVVYGTQGGTAQAGADYRARPGTVTIQARQPEETVTVLESIIDDEDDESDETVGLDIRTADGAQIESKPFTIGDDDGALDATVCAVAPLRPAINALAASPAHDTAKNAIANCR